MCGRSVTFRTSGGKAARIRANYQLSKISHPLSRSAAARMQAKHLQLTLAYREEATFGLAPGSRYFTVVYHPIIISSQVWSPHLTSFVGSGLNLFLIELSKWATQSSLVPFGRKSGLLQCLSICY